MTDTTQNNSKPISLTKTWTWAGVLIAVDAFILNQGVLSALVGLWMLFVSLPRAVFNKEPEQRHRRFARVAIFLAAVLLVFGLNWANNQVAHQRAETLVVAIKAFNQQHQRYPERLDELVPEYIDHVPATKYTLGSPSFRYVSTPEDHSLFYVAMPPFGRRVYSFERNEWFSID